MNKTILPAIFFSILTYGAASETHRIFVEEKPDTGLRIMAIVFTLAFLTLALIFWFKKPTPKK